MKYCTKGVSKGHSSSDVLRDVTELETMMQAKKKKMGRPRLAKNWTAELLNERANEYFNKCDGRTKTSYDKKGNPYEEEWPEPYSIEGLCVYLDVTRYEFDAWRKRPDELGKRAEKIHLKIMANRITGALDGDQNPSFAQFMLKNNAPEDYKEKVEVENTIGERAQKIFDDWSEKWVKLNSEARNGD